MNGVIVEFDIFAVTAREASHIEGAVLAEFGENNEGMEFEFSDDFMIRSKPGCLLWLNACIDTYECTQIIADLAARVTGREIRVGGSVDWHEAFDECGIAYATVVGNPSSKATV